MIINTAKAIPSSEITDPQVFKNRRNIIKALLATAAVGSGLSPLLAEADEQQSQLLAQPDNNRDLPVTPRSLVENYTNYYEFSYKKQDSTQLAQGLLIDPWLVEISGEVENPTTIYLDDLLQKQTLEERIYRFRCVEGWSMVIPWVGFPLAALLKTVKPLSSARFVKFTSISQPEVMPNQKSNVLLTWPYTEALRMDEALHPLTILAVGMYGEHLPKQNGAPLRLVVPWKYGFKSIKAIVKIELLKNAPITSWSKAAPQDYGFYANINPSVPHPRWSQRTERLLGSRFFTPRRQTELFNGYGEQVAGLYREMDLRHFF